MFVTGLWITHFSNISNWFGMTNFEDISDQFVDNKRSKYLGLVCGEQSLKTFVIDLSIANSENIFECLVYIKL